MISVDTNVFVYAIDQREPVKQSIAPSILIAALLSEDLADGLVHGGLEIVNPFGPDGPSQRLHSLLSLS